MAGPAGVADQKQKLTSPLENDPKVGVPMEKQSGGTFAVATNGGQVHVVASDVSGWGQAAHADSGGSVRFVNCRADAPRIAALRLLLEDAPLPVADKERLFAFFSQLDGPPSQAEVAKAKGLLESLSWKHSLFGLAIVERLKALFNLD